jgi:hypothetical protein
MHDDDPAGMGMLFLALAVGLTVLTGGLRNASRDPGLASTLTRHARLANVSRLPPLARAVWSRSARSR